MKRKVICLVLAAVLALALAAPAAAAEVEVVEIDAGGDEITTLFYDAYLDGLMCYYNDAYNMFPIYVIPETGAVVRDMQQKTGDYMEDRENGLKGLIKRDGTQVLPYEYDEVEVMDNGLICAMKLYNGQDYWNDGIWTLFDGNGKEIVTGGSWKPDSMSREYVIYYPGKREAAYIYDGQGNQVATYENANPFQEGLAYAVTEDGQVVYLDSSLEPAFTVVGATSGGDFSDGLAAVCDGVNFGYIDKTGATVIPCQYVYAGYFEYGLTNVHGEQGESYIIDTAGKVVLSGYDDMWVIGQDLVAVEIGGKWGAYSVSAGALVAPVEYDDCYMSMDGLITASKQEENENGYVVYLNNQFDTDGKAIVRDSEESLLIELVPGIYAEDHFDDADFSHFYKLYDRNGALFDGQTFDYAKKTQHGTVIVEKNGKCGVIKADGTVLAPFEYDDITDEADYYVAKNDGKSAMYDLDFNKISKDYDTIREMSNGLVMVGNVVSPDRIWERVFGYVDRKGREVIAPQYTRAFDFGDSGRAVVQYNGKNGTVDRQGNFTALPETINSVSLACGDIVVYAQPSADTVSYGLSDVDGNVLTEAKYASIDQIQNSDDFLAKGTDGKYYILNVDSYPGGFADVNQAWMEEPVKFAYNHGLMKGTGENTFDPNATLNLGTALTVTARICGVDTTPLDGEAWTAPAMSWAHRMGLTASDDVLAGVSRQEMVYMIWVAAGKPDNYGLYDAMACFTDAGLVKDEYRDAVEWAVSEKIFNGSGPNTLDPNGVLTRAQLAAFVQRAYPTIVTAVY